jgi:predicted DNA-binding mobile mystery protein A
MQRTPPSEFASSIRQLDINLERLRAVRAEIPPGGWLRALREALGMSMAQLGRRMGLPRQGVLALEQREASGAVSLKTLREAAAALDAEVVYAIVPRASLRQMLEQQARRKAGEELSLLAQAMPPESQRGQGEEEAALRRRTAEWLLARPRALWDDEVSAAGLRRRIGAVLSPPTPVAAAAPAAVPAPATTFRPPPDAS